MATPAVATPNLAVHRSIYDSYFFRMRTRLMGGKTRIEGPDGRPSMPLLLMAGALAGITTKSSVAPLERIKILFQTQGMRIKSGTANVRYSGVMDAARTILTQEGVRSFWKGNGSNCLRVMPVYALKFGFNDKFKTMVARPGQSVNSLGMPQLVLSGTCAGLFQACITYPLELIRTRLTLGATHGSTYAGVADCARQTLAQEGVRGFYKGLTPTILSGAPYVGLQMSGYELYKRNLAPEIEAATGSQTLAKLVCGAAGGVTAQTLMYPGDTVRRRMQTDGMQGRARVYGSMMDCVRQTVAKEGYRGLFSGLGVNCLRAVPGAGIQFLAYEWFKYVLTGAR